MQSSASELILNSCFPSVNWLDHGRTLREQGVEETEMLLLRRKFFYSDQNVDSRDPVQLNLLYVQVGKSVALWAGLFPAPMSAIMKVILMLVLHIS